jgi:hypothetical protein
MAVWLYQMSINGRFTPEECRRDIEQNTLCWDVHQIRYRGHGKPFPGDKIVLFFCKTKCNEPGIYGVGQITDFTRKRIAKRKSKRERTLKYETKTLVTFVMEPPTDTLKKIPAWDNDIEHWVNSVRDIPQATLFGMAQEEFDELKTFWTHTDAESEDISEKIERSEDTIAGYERDSKTRKAIEDRAIVVAKETYESQGYTIEEVGKPYDLRCLRNSEEVRVEVKGTRSNGESVIVTVGEVEHARKASCRVDFVLVTGITVIAEPKGGVIADGGDIACHIKDWKPAEGDLTPTEYRYSTQNIVGIADQL